jgi:hypothetical protein
MSPSPFPLVLTLGVLAGCASGGAPERRASSTASPAAPPFSQQGNAYYIDLPPEPAVNSTRVAGTPERLFPRLAAVYEELGIPLATVQPRTYVLGNPQFRTRQRVGEMRMSSIVDCGKSIIGVSADTRPVTLSVHTQLKADGADNVVVETTLYGTAQVSEGVDSPPLNCSSRGALERHIAERLAAGGAT